MELCFEGELADVAKVIINTTTLHRNNQFPHYTENVKTIDLFVFAAGGLQSGLWLMLLVLSL